MVSLADPVTRHRAQVPSLRVLVANENAQASATIAELLERSGHTVCRVNDGEDALDALTINDFAVALVSLRLPKFSGLEVVQHVRVMQAGDRHRTRVLVVVADDASDDALRCLSAGAYGVLDEPVKVEVLLNQIAGIVTNPLSSRAPMKGSAATGAEARSTTNRSLVLDEAVLDEYIKCGFGLEFVVALQEQSLRECKHYLSCLKRAGLSGKWPIFHEHVYALKGVAANIGLTGVCRAATSVLALTDNEVALAWREHISFLSMELDLAQQALSERCEPEQRATAVVTWLAPR